MGRPTSVTRSFSWDVRLDPADRARLVVRRDEHHGLAALVRQQSARENSPARAGAVQLPGRGKTVELAERTVPPAQHVPPIDDLANGDRGLRRERAVLDLGPAIGPFQQITQRFDGVLRPGELVFQPREVRCDQLVACDGVLRGHDGFDVRNGHVRLAQPEDHLRGRNLVE